MMTKENLEEVWSTISHSNLGEFEYKLISVESIPLLNVGYSNSGERCLLLELPASLENKNRQELRQNISLKYFPKEHCLCIILNDIFFKDLFDDLILSIYSKTYKITLPEHYAEIFAKHFLKWSSFFEVRGRYGLSPAQVKGLFGELVFLREQLSVSGSGVDDILRGWRGPYDQGHDFVFENIDYEIKTIEQGKNSFSISSEYQLETDPGKSLELVLVTVDTDILSGLSIADISHEIKQMILESFGDQSIFLSALSHKGLEINNVFLYDSFRFMVNYMTYYQVSGVAFPKLIRSAISDELFEISYSIRVNLIEQFVSKKIMI